MPGIQVSMLLADAAQAVGGKLYVLGGGWSIIGPGLQPFAIAMTIKTPWDQANVRHTFRLELLDADGNAVLIETDDGEQPLLLEGEFEAGRPVGIKAGTPLDGVLAVNVAPVQLPPGSRLEWRLSIDGETDEDWTLPFSTRPSPPAQSQAA